MGEVFDSELQGLLDELADPAPLAPLVEDQPAPSQVAGEVPVELSAPLIADPILSDPEPSAVQVESTDLVLDSGADSTASRVESFLATHDRDYEETKRNIRNDRAKVDAVLQLLLLKVNNGGATAAETESLVAAAKALVDSNGHMVRLLDSKSKLLTSIRGSTNIVNNNVASVSGSELINILSQDVADDRV